MSKKVRTTNIIQKGSRAGEIDDRPNIKVGDCIFPFKYYKDPVKKGEKIDWNECVDGNPLNIHGSQSGYSPLFSSAK